MKTLRPILVWSNDSNVKIQQTVRLWYLTLIIQVTSTLKSLPFVRTWIVYSLFDVLLGECLFDSNSVVKKLHDPS